MALIGPYLFMDARDRSGISLASDSPKIFHALGRFLDTAQLAQLERDYIQAQARGGNTEPLARRAEGVSFNPRLARVLSLLIHDGGVRDLMTLRAALYGAVLLSGASFQRTQIETQQFEFSREQELIEIVEKIRTGVGDDPVASRIHAVIALDDVRHLHQSSLELSEQELVLEYASARAEELARFSDVGELVVKLRHAVVLQRRRAQASEV